MSKEGDECERGFKTVRVCAETRVCVIGCKAMDVARIEDYMRDIDRSLLRENLKLTPAQRLEKFVKFRGFTSELRRAGEISRQRSVTGKAHRP